MGGEGTGGGGSGVGERGRREEAGSRWGGRVGDRGTGGGGMTLLCLSCRASRRSSFSERGRRGCASQCGVRPALLPERCRTAITTHA